MTPANPDNPYDFLHTGIIDPDTGQVTVGFADIFEVFHHTWDVTIEVSHPALGFIPMPEGAGVMRIECADTTRSWCQGGADHKLLMYKAYRLGSDGKYHPYVYILNFNDNTVHRYQLTKGVREMKWDSGANGYTVLTGDWNLRTKTMENPVRHVIHPPAPDARRTHRLNDDVILIDEPLPPVYTPVYKHVYKPANATKAKTVPPRARFRIKDLPERQRTPLLFAIVGGIIYLIMLIAKIIIDIC